jgi:hypothetical protein
MRSVTRLFSIPALAIVALVAAPGTARADATAFRGYSPSPAGHAAKGRAIGAGLVVVGFEFEYCDLNGDFEEDVPSLKTGSANLLVQTPVPINGWQFYATLGGGIYRERLEAVQETHVSTNVGGGAKYTLTGPLRLRFDYRIFSLMGSPVQSKVHRFYAGVNIAF